MISGISANLGTYKRDQSSVFTSINLIYILLFTLALFYFYNDYISFYKFVILDNESIIYDLTRDREGLDSLPNSLSHDYTFLPHNLSFILIYLNNPL